MRNLLFSFVIFLGTFAYAQQEQSYAAELEALWQRPEYAAVTTQDWAAGVITGFECRRAFEDPIYPRFKDSMQARIQFANKMIAACLQERNGSPLALFLRPELTPRLYACVTKLCDALELPVPMICAVNGNGQAMKVIGNLQNYAVIIINTQSIRYSDSAFEGMIAQILVSIKSYAQVRAYVTVYGTTALSTALGVISGTLLSYALGDYECITPAAHVGILFNSGYIAALLGYQLGLKLNKQRIIAQDEHAVELLENNQPMIDFLKRDAEIMIEDRARYAETLEHYAAQIHTAHPALATDVINTARALKTSLPVLPADVPSYAERLQKLACS